MKHQSIVSFSEQAPGPTRRALAKQQTRQRLLSSAKRLFVSRGYEAATVRDIAADANLSTGAVFASFSDKADLFNEVIIADCERLFQDMAAVKDAGSTAETLLTLLSIGYDFHYAQLPLTQAALAFSWVRSGEHEDCYRRAARRVIDRLAEVLKAGVASGELSDDLDTDLTGEMLFDSYLCNLRRAIFDGWGPDALRARLKNQISVLLAGWRAAA
jgi:AcrR family transcriptional regulator